MRKGSVKLGDRVLIKYNLEEYFGSVTGILGTSVEVLRDEGFSEIYSQDCLTVVGKAHPRFQTIVAYANGARIQQMDSEEFLWCDVERPHFYDDVLYRVKPAEPSLEEKEKAKILAEMGRLKRRLEALGG